MNKTIMLSELFLITQDRSYFKISCSYFDIAAEVSGQELLWPRSSILVLLESILQQFASSSWITCGEGKDGIERSVWSGVSTKCTVRGTGEAVDVDGVLRGQRRRYAPGEAVEVDGMLQGQRRRHALHEADEVDGVLQGRRWRRALGETVEVAGEAIEWVEGEAVEATACSGVKWSRASSVGGGMLRALATSKT
jgi:hypothetical protein